MEDGIARALVGLPFGDQAAQALVEKLLIDDDVVSHDEGESIMRPSGDDSGRRWWWRESDECQKSRVGLATRATR